MSIVRVARPTYRASCAATLSGVWHPSQRKYVSMSSKCDQPLYCVLRILPSAFCLLPSAFLLPPVPVYDEELQAQSAEQGEEEEEHDNQVELVQAVEISVCAVGDH